MDKKISKIQYITQDSEILSHAEQAKLMFETGIDWVQIRMKEASPSEFKAEAELALRYAKEFNGKIIINDSIDIAKDIEAHGVHLGLNDVSISDARIELGDKFIIGGTANTIEDIEYQSSQGADYIGLGPFKFTQTKKNLSPIIGLEGYKEILEQLQRKKLNIPIVAVGSVTMGDLEQLQSIGLFGISVSSDLLKSKIQDRVHI